MGRGFLPFILGFIIISCSEKPVIHPDFDFKQVKTVIIYPTPDYKLFPGSGSIVDKSIVYHLMKIGIKSC